MTFPGTSPASYTSGANPRSYSSSPIAPAGPSTSSSSGTRNNKLEHIIQNFYTKTVQISLQITVSCWQLIELGLTRWMSHILRHVFCWNDGHCHSNKSILDGNSRDMEMYEFSDVVTPLGIFKLQVQYRKNCDFRVEDSERDLSARMMDLHEQFFTPTMDKHKQEQQRPRSAVFYDEQEEALQRAVHRFSSSFASRPSSIAAASDSREQRQRRTSIGLRGSPTGSLKDTVLSRAAAAQQQQQQQQQPISRSGEGMIGRPQASFSDRVRSTTTMTEGASGSGSMRSRIEFSPSFDKLREHTRSPSRTDLTRRWSRTSEHSSINLDGDDTGLEDFMRLAAATPELKMFQSRNYTSQFMDTDGGNVSPTSDTSAGGMAASGSAGGASIHRSKKALSHFRSLRDAHNTLSESMTSSVLARSGGGDTPSSPTTAAGMAGGVSLGSSTSSSAGRSYMPVVPSPLHATDNPSSDDLRNYQHRNSDPSTSPGRIIHPHQRHHSLSQQQQLGPGSSSSNHSMDRSPPAFSSYHKDRHHDELRRLYDEDIMGDRVSANTGGVANHSSGGSTRYRGNSLISDNASTDIRRQESMNSLREHRTSIVDDDDSLVFKMSELGVEGGSGSSSLYQQQQQQQDPPPFAFSQPPPMDPYSNDTRDYSQCLTIGTHSPGVDNNSASGASNSHSGTSNVDHVTHQTLRRMGSSTSLRQQPSSMATVVEEEEKSASSSASEDIYPR
ncbi:hypothetical protein K492DRAFT_181053 [Lichtheimia hyalospora FSU 10163]|nr:hypothetical protein K492DRAFT_181053 [Lichtheimia hyalospora FSU 10163]